MTYREAIETIKVAKAEVEWEYPMDYYDAFDTAIKSLKQTTWIPVSEKLPMKGRQVLCCNKYGSVFTSELTWSKGYLMFGQHSNVIAWMPLPEAYKEEGAE